MRQCKKCGETKELTEFYTHDSGFTHTCKLCTSAYSREWYRNNRERKAKTALGRRQTSEGKAVVLLGHMRTSCRKLGFQLPEFTADEIAVAIDGQFCAATGIPFDLVHTGPSRRNPFAPSPDRLNPSLGYTKANVQWVCWMYNIMKCDFSQEDVSKFIQSLMRVSSDHHHLIRQ